MLCHGPALWQVSMLLKFLAKFQDISPLAESAREIFSRQGVKKHWLLTDLLRRPFFIELGLFKRR
jgi:hypothetical protein